MNEKPDGAEPYNASRLEEAIRESIEGGELRPGDQLPTAATLAQQYGVNKNTVSRAITALKAVGLLTGPAGGRTFVRIKPPRITRRNTRYHLEKERALESDHERAQFGVAESDSGISLREFHEDTYRYEVCAGPDDVREILGVRGDADLLRRTYRRRHAAGAGASVSVSYLPYDLVRQNPDLLDDSREPWPGGTMHQLSTIGIELDHIDDHVIADMPTPEEQELLDIPPRVPLIRLRKISWTTDDTAVEVSDIPLPADRARLIYTTPLKRWS